MCKSVVLSSFVRVPVASGTKCQEKKNRHTTIVYTSTMQFWVCKIRSKPKRIYYEHFGLGIASKNVIIILGTFVSIRLFLSLSISQFQMQHQLNPNMLVVYSVLTTTNMQFKSNLTQFLFIQRIFFFSLSSFFAQWLPHFFYKFCLYQSQSVEFTLCVLFAWLECWCFHFYQA